VPSGGKRQGGGRKPDPRLTQEEIEALIQEQGGGVPKSPESHGA
jgi:hypothetical protein